MPHSREAATSRVVSIIAMGLRMQELTSRNEVMGFCTALLATTQREEGRRPERRRKVTLREKRLFTGQIERR